MTAADLFYALELPMLASDPRVRVVEDMEWELESCEQCVQRSLQADVTAGIPAGKWRLTYHLKPGGPEWRTDLCGPDCADVELDEVLNLHNCVGVVLHVPASKFLPSGLQDPLRTPADLVASEDDEMFLAVDALLRYVQTLPDPGDVEAFRRKVVAAVASLGLDRIAQLGRTA